MDLISELKNNTSKILSHSKKIRDFLGALVDENSFVETDVFMSGKSYLDGSDALGEGVVTGYATINDYPVCIVAQNNEVLGGSIGAASAKKIVKCIERAIKTDTALLSIINSNGGRIGEGMDMLEGFGTILTAMNEAKASIPTITVLEGNAIALMGMYAAASDFVFMGENSVLSVLPPLAVSNGANIPANKVVGAASYAEKSLIPAIIYKNDLKAKLCELFEYINEEYVDTESDPNEAYDALNSAVTTDALLKAVADDNCYLELYAGYATDVKTVLTSVNSIPVGVVITNGEKLGDGAVKKISRFVKLLDDYALPLVTFVDSKGIASDLTAEQAGLVLDCSEMLTAIMSADIAKIAVITGSAIGFSYVSLASKASGFDYVLAFTDAKIAPITGEQAVSIMYPTEIASDNVAASKKALADKYDAMQANPFVSAKDGYVDNIIEPALVRPYLSSALTMLVK